MDVTINLGKKDIYTEVSKLTSMVGKKRQDGNSPDMYIRVSATDTDFIVFEPYFSEAISILVSEVRMYTKSVQGENVTADNISSETFEIKLDLPTTFDSSALTISIRASMRSFLVNYIAAKWFEITLPNEAQAYASAAQTALENIRAKISTRKRPSYTAPQTTNINTNGTTN